MSHCFYEIAVPLIYETLNVRFSDYKSLQHIVTEIKENPRRRQSLTHARPLNVMVMPENTRQEVFNLDRLKAETDMVCPDENVRARDLIPDRFGNPENFFSKQLSEPLPLTLEIRREPGFYEERNWKPLVWLISSMIHLTEMHYLLKNMFLKCLLKVIHKYYPTCQLNV